MQPNARCQRRIRIARSAVAPSTRRLAIKPRAGANIAQWIAVRRRLLAAETVVGSPMEMLLAWPAERNFTVSPLTWRQRTFVRWLARSAIEQSWSGNAGNAGLRSRSTGRGLNGVVSFVLPRASQKQRARSCRRCVWRAVECSKSSLLKRGTRRAPGVIAQ